jgi:hypothetical protein
MKTSFRRLLPLVLLLTLPAVMQAQYTDTSNNGAITITGYTGSGGAVTISSTTNGLPVTSIGGGRNVGAFDGCTSLTAGTDYRMQARAIGGSTGYSDGSDPVSQISI